MATRASARLKAKKALKDCPSKKKETGEVKQKPCDGLKVIKNGPPKKKRKTDRGKEQQWDIAALRATLDGLSDNVVLIIMAFVDTMSLVRLSCVNRRFHHLAKDKSLWEIVNLTHGMYWSQLSNRDIRSIICNHFQPSVKDVTLSSSIYALLPRRQVVTFSLLNDLLFVKCPNIQKLTLMNCDIAKFDQGNCSGKKSARMYHSESLKCLTLNYCQLPSDGWLNKVRPSWPNLTELSLINTDGITDDDLRYIGSCEEWRKNLRYLSIEGSWVSEHVLIEVCALLTGLKTLDVREPVPVDDHQPNDFITDLREELKQVSTIHFTSVVQTDQVIHN